jgi:hypothetical protein
MSRRTWLASSLFLIAAACPVFACASIVGIHEVPAGTRSDDASDDGASADGTIDAAADSGSFAFCVKGVVQTVSQGQIIVLVTDPPNCGHLAVNVNASTSYSPPGYTPAMNDQLRACGSGDCSTSVTAAAVFGPGK